MEYESQIKDWLLCDEQRFHALEIAASLDLKDWCLAAGFVRNMIWDRLHEKGIPTPLNDIDLIYFDPDDTAKEVDIEFEKKLKEKLNLPWSVKNQARMHIRNHDPEYLSTSDAMSYWVEIETAIGVKLSEKREFEIIAPFGCEKNFSNTITINTKRMKPSDFKSRMTKKGWQSIWPRLIVIA